MFLFVKIYAMAQPGWAIPLVELQVLKPGAALVIEGEGMPHKEEPVTRAGAAAHGGERWSWAIQAV